MVDQLKTKAEILANIPPRPIAKNNRVKSNPKRGHPQVSENLRNGIQTLFGRSAQSRVLAGEAGGELETAVASTVSTASAYRLDTTKGAILVDGVYARPAAQTDLLLRDAGPQFARLFGLDGLVPPLLVTNNTEYQAAYVWALVAGVPTDYVIFSAEAATGTGVDPTPDQIRAALAIGAPTALLDSILVSGRWEILHGVGTITDTHKDKDTDDALEAERRTGSFAVT